MKALALLLLLPACLAAGQADRRDGSLPDLRFNAYGTLGVVYTDEDRADLVAGLFQSEGAGFTSTVSPKVDSRLGLQGSARFGDRLSGVVQVVVEQDADGDFAPRLEWANLKYQLTPDLSVRAGRMVQPVLMVSEYRKVGYATPWVRPPEEVYRIVPITNFDGVDFNYRLRFGNYTNTLQGIYGRSEPEAPDGSDVLGEQIMTLSNTGEWRDLSVTASVGRYRLSVDALTPLMNAFRSLGPAGAALAERYEVDEARVTVATLGARYDPGNWFLMGEYAGSRTETVFGDARGAYLTLGYRFGAFTPYLSIARAWNAGNQSPSGLPVQGLPPALATAVSQLNAGLGEVLKSAVVQRSLTLGTRWDFASSMALKLQYEYVDMAAGSAGRFTNLQPGFDRGGHASVLSLTFDFVF